MTAGPVVPPEQAARGLWARWGRPVGIFRRARPYLVLYLPVGVRTRPIDPWKRRGHYAGWPVYYHVEGAITGPPPADV